MAGLHADTPRAERVPITIPVTAGPLWLVATALFSLVLYYVIGIDQGAVSLISGDTHIHEFVHDARHFLGFPCH